MIGKYKTRRQRGFTLLELLIVIGVVGILSSIVIVAVNPAEQFEKARNARRTSDANQLEKAFIQYIIKGNNLPSEVSTGYDGATSICKQTISDSSCINVDSLLTPDYIVAIPQDDEEENPNFSGYVVYQDSEGAPHVNSAYITNWIPGLIGMWRFDEGGGIVAVDSSGNENHGMLSSTGDGELITNGGAETGDTTNFAFDGVTNTDSNTDTYSFYEEGPKSFRSSEFIPIDITKTYNQEGWFKSYGAGGDSRLYFGYVPYDENQVQISHHHVGVITDTEATLIENISSSDTVVKISNCSNWYVLSYGYMAFNIDDSGNYNDLPNRDLSNKGIESVSGDLGGYCEIEFKTTVGKTYPAGTKVRMHKSGGSYMYVAAAGAYIPTVWTSYSSSITGESISGTIYSEGFWRGTRFVKFLFLANYGQDSTFKFRTDDLSIKSVPATYTGPDWASGQIGSALDFDGVDDFVNAGSNPNLQITGALTMSFWMYARGSSSDAGLVGTGIGGYQCTYHNGATVYCYIDNGGNSISYAASLNAWHHVVLSWDGTTNENGIKLYLDGALVNERTSSSSSISGFSDFIIGDSTTNFDGLIDDVHVYNSNLSADEILSLYEEGSSE